MSPEEHKDPTWKLLRNASQQLPSANFTQRVMQSVKLMEEENSRRKVSYFQTLKTGWRPYALAACAACCAIFIGIGTVAKPTSSGSHQAYTAFSLNDSTSTFENSDLMEDSLEDSDYRTQLITAIDEPSHLEDEDLFTLLSNEASL